MTFKTSHMPLSARARSFKTFLLALSARFWWITVRIEGATHNRSAAGQGAIADAHEVGYRQPLESNMPFLLTGVPELAAAWTRGQQEQRWVRKVLEF